MALSFRMPAESDAALILEWRTRPDITKHMLTDVPHDLDRHLQWFRHCSTRDDYMHRLMCVDEHPVGYVSVTVTHTDWGIGSLGVFVGDDRGRHGDAPLNFAYMLNHAFFTLGLRKIVNQIMGSNDRLLKGQPMLGYRPVGVLKEQVVKNGRVEDLHIFEMLRGEWIAKRVRFGIYQDLDGRYCQS